ncbi:MAG: hypothetical protein WC627_12570, partial [Legionella sp.]
LWFYFNRLFARIGGSKLTISISAYFRLISGLENTAPFPLAIGNNIVGRFLLKLNTWLIKLSKSLFSYQIAIKVRPVPTLDILMQQAIIRGAEAQSSSLKSKIPTSTEATGSFVA